MERNGRTRPGSSWLFRHREEMIGGSIYLLVVLLDVLFRDRLTPLLGGYEFDIAALLLLFVLILVASRALKKTRSRKETAE
jgi:hypothetical protein